MSCALRPNRMVKLVPVEDLASAERCDDGSILMRDETMLMDFLTFHFCNWVLRYFFSQDRTVRLPVCNHERNWLVYNPDGTTSDFLSMEWADRC